MTVPRYKVFDAEKKKGKKPDPVKFSLAGEEFECLPALPAGVVADLPEMISTRALIGFIKGVLIDGDDERFEEAIHRRDVIVTQDHITDVFNWLCEVYGDRPTVPSKDSANGAGPTGDSSTDGSLSLVSP